MQPRKLPYKPNPNRYILSWRIDFERFWVAVHHIECSHFIDEIELSEK